MAGSPDQEWQGDLAGPEWVYFTDSHLRRAIFFVNRDDDDLIDSYWRMKSMTVLGSGRLGSKRHPKAAPKRLTAGLWKNPSPECIYIQTLLRSHEGWRDQSKAALSCHFPGLSAHVQTDQIAIVVAAVDSATGEDRWRPARAGEHLGA